MVIKTLIKYVFVFALFLSTNYIAIGQGGISFTAGIAGAKNHLKEASKGGIGIGYTGAVEARFLGQDMYFVAALQYAKYKLIPVEGIELASQTNNFQVGHGRIGMGFTILRLGYNTIIRAKILGSLDKTMQYTSATLKNTDFNKEDNSPSDKLNDATVGALVGLGLDLKWFVLDFEYERGLINAFYKVPGSNFDYFSVRAGILIK